MKAVLMHSDFVVGDDDSMSESEGAEPAMALYARQQIDAAAALYDMPRQGPSRPDSVAPSPAMRRPPIMVTARRPPPELGPSAEEEAMAGEAQEFAEETHAANGALGRKLWPHKASKESSRLRTTSQCRTSLTTGRSMACTVTSQISRPCSTRRRDGHD